ncbi:HAD family hydrolase [Oligoflexaceae bacterium]|nr:HAD family hydrolase [Oligoflexaceae bacterium]
MSYKAVYLDRDGVLNKDVGYAFQLEQLTLLPGVKRGLEQLKSKNFKLIVVTNQSGVARGMFAECDVKKFNEALNQQVGGAIDSFYYCPFHTEAKVDVYRKDSNDRKPNTGMLERAAKEHDLKKVGSFLIGDKASDVETAKRFGVKSVQIKSRYDIHKSPDALVANFTEAVDFILQSDS